MNIKLTNRIKSSRFFSGIFWTTFGAGLSRLLVIVGSIVSANILGAEKYGEFGIIRSTINVLLVVAGLNIGAVLTKYISEFREKDKEKCALMVTQNYLFVFFLTFLFSLLLYFSASFISNSILESPQLENELKLSAFILFFGITFPLNESVFRGFEWFKELGIIQILGSMSFIVFVPLGSYYNGVYGAISGYFLYSVIMSLVTSLLLYKMLKKDNLSIFKIDRLSFKFNDLLKLTLPILLASLVEAPFFWAAQALLIRDSGMIEIGYVNAIFQIRNLALILPSYVSMVSLPLLSNAISKSNDIEFKHYFKNSLRVNLIFSILCTIPLIFFSKEILLLFGNDFKVSFWASFWAYLSIPFLVVVSVVNQSLIAKGRGWINLYIALTWNIIFISLVYYLMTIGTLETIGYMFSLFISILILVGLKFYYNFKLKNHS